MQRKLEKRRNNMSCKSCNFPIGERETKKTCSVCNGATHSFCIITEDGIEYCDHCFILKDQAPKVFEFEMPDEIRRTHIETYRSCPRKFYMEVIEGNKMPDNPYTRVGSDLHELFEKAILDRSYSKEQFYKDYEPMQVEQVSTNLFENHQQVTAFKDRATDSVETFYEVIPNIPPAFIVEETLRFDVGEGLPKVRFTMDLITENEKGNLDLHDWKTGKVMVGKKISADLQAPLYIYGVQQHYGRQVDSFTFYYLKDKKTRTFNRVQENVYECIVGKRSYFINILDTYRELQSIFNKIAKGEFDVPQDTRGMYFTCKMCHIQEMGLCEGAENQSWHQIRG